MKRIDLSIESIERIIKSLKLDILASDNKSVENSIKHDIELFQDLLNNNK